MLDDGEERRDCEYEGLVASEREYASRLCGAFCRTYGAPQLCFMLPGLTPRGLASAAPPALGRCTGRVVSLHYRDGKA